MKASIRNLCDHLTRKPLNWNEVANIPQAAILLAEAGIKELPRFATSENNPMQTFPEVRPQVFVAVLGNGQEFVVNTEGYPYARYVGRLNLDDTAPRDAKVEQDAQAEKLIRHYGEAAVEFTAALRSALAEGRIEEAVDGVLQVSKLRDDGHGLNFLVELEDGWRRVIVTSP